MLCYHLLLNINTKTVAQIAAPVPKFCIVPRMSFVLVVRGVKGNSEDMRCMDERFSKNNSKIVILLSFLSLRQTYILKCHSV